MIIDPHVHCRDGKQAYKETISHVFKIAKQQGVQKVFDMPNTDPPILLKSDVQKRLKIVPKDQKNNYYLYIGASADKKQLTQAVEAYRKYRQVIGIKLYAGKSVGELAVVSKNDQQKIYQTLADLAYDGVLAVHCEKEKYLKPALFDHSKPITHCHARPKKAEIESIKDQIYLAKSTKFNGTLHIVHVSCPESVNLINTAGKTIKITCAVTPHHIMWSNRVLHNANGLLYKMNPPLRDVEDVNKLRKCLKQGKIDWVETDHAPHAIGEKLFSPYLSGYPSLYLYKYFVKKFLPNLKISTQQIKKLTSENICQTFSNKLTN